MAFSVTPFEDLPITDEVEWNPTDRPDSELIAEILGDPPDWDRFKRAHLAWDSENDEIQGGYKLKVARMHNGRLTVIFNQLANRLAVINGARGGVDLPRDIKEKAFNHGLRYYDKLEVEKDDQPTFTGIRQNLSRIAVRLEDVELAKDDDKPKWVHIARTGEYRGYGGGDDPFNFEEKHFQEMVRNFRASPVYETDALGVGNAHVVPWDFSHASEANPTEGSLPVKGAPAQGWTLELEIRNGKDGTKELWALTEFLEPAKTYIREEKYRWASVGVYFDAVHPESGKNIGAFLNTIALTNTPFIEGMEPLVASKVQAMHYYGESAGTATEAVSFMRDMLGLTQTDGIAEVMTELQKIQQWITMGTTPLGVDVVRIVGDIRRILNLPALMTETEVMANAVTMVGRVIEENAIESGAAGLQEPVPPLEIADKSNAMVAKNGGNEMEVKQLAKDFGVSASEAEVTTAIGDAVELRNKAKQALSCERDSNKVILEAVEKAVDMKTKLEAMLGMMEIKDVDEAIAKLTSLLEDSKKMTDLMPELEQLRADFKKREDAEAEKEVDEVIASRGWDESFKHALLLTRTNDPDKFKELYPPLTQDQANLTKDIATKGKTPVSTQTGQTQQNTGDVIDLTMYPGNPTQKVVAHIRATNPDSEKWSREKLYETAFAFKDANAKQLRVS
jgi:hypothetical protein